MESTRNKTALITGGTKGIGYGVAEALVNQNINVAITGRSKELIDETVKKLNILGRGEAIGFEADVRNAESQNIAIAGIIKKWGKLDILIANAGVGHFGSIEDISTEQWLETIDTNLTGVFYSIKASLEELKKTKGYIITIASLAGTNFFAGASAYNASKFGLVGFTQAVMLDIRKYGIKVTTIMPGSVATQFNDHVVSETDAWKIQPEDIGQMVVDLLLMNPRTLPSKIEVRPTTPK
ncbi:MAG TPA: SDR family oxidoreductase [Chryseolinea sp.]|nr:SDR family oxidoreductase [Chryseolinea sp.]HPM29145.1 SDR family oxidoreductase [Chryseolinea sp.]